LLFTDPSSLFLAICAGAFLAYPPPLHHPTFVNCEIRLFGKNQRGPARDEDVRAAPVPASAGMGSSFNAACIPGKTPESINLARLPAKDGIRI